MAGTGNGRSDGVKSGSIDLDSYVNGQIETVNGWLGDVDIFAIKAIGEWQAEQGIAGDLAEIGVHHGKLYFILALLRRASEKALAMDLFEDDAMNVGAHARRDIMLHRNADRLGIDISDAEIWKVDSTTITPAQIAEKVGNVRLFSVDGGHEYHHVAADLRTAESVLGDRGVIIIDDIFGIGWPDVTVAAMHFLTEYADRIEPFLITRSKLYVCRKGAAADYRAMLETHADTAAMPKDERNMFRQPITVMKLGRSQFLGRRLLRRFRRTA